MSTKEPSSSLSGPTGSAMAKARSLRALAEAVPALAIAEVDEVAVAGARARGGSPEAAAARGGGGGARSP
eukprot:7647398-Alexandrium_andersonii.AAC.1